MANPEHLEILKQGVDVWNRWRRENPEVKVDLSEANLYEANLFRANFSNAYLSRTYLSKADLSKADLSKANLYEATLPGANLSRADLSRANLPRANLFKANLSGANLTGADLTGVDLSGADLSKATLSEANLSGTKLQFASFMNTLLLDIDLRNVEGLDMGRHRGPSYIDTSTIIRSKGNIPESFLRGCGVPNYFIEYIKSLSKAAHEYYSCFISYSNKNEDFAKRLYENLQNMGVRCWYAPEDMKTGDKIRDRIDQSIRVHDKLLLVLSEHSNNSDWVEDEVESAYEQEQKRKTTVLFPIRLDDAVMDTEKAWAAKLRRSRHIGDFTEWKDHDSYQKAFDRVLNDLKAEKE